MSETAKQVIANANSLLLAVNRLQSGSSQISSRAEASSQAQAPLQVARSHIGFPQAHSSPASSIHNESPGDIGKQMNKLFHWNSHRNKQKRPSVGATRKSKKKRLQTWTHNILLFI